MRVCRPSEKVARGAVTCWQQSQRVKRARLPNRSRLWAAGPIRGLLHPSEFSANENARLALRALTTAKSPASAGQASLSGQAAQGPTRRSPSPSMMSLWRSSVAIAIHLLTLLAAPHTSRNTGLQWASASSRQHLTRLTGGREPIVHNGPYGHMSRGEGQIRKCKQYRRRIVLLPLVPGRTSRPHLRLFHSYYLLSVLCAPLQYNSSANIPMSQFFRSLDLLDLDLS